MKPELAESIRREMALIEGWTSPERGIEMAELILEHKPKVCVELGVFAGKSLIPQAMALQQNGQGVIYGLDPWKVESALEGNDESEDHKKWWSGGVDLEAMHRMSMHAIWKLGLDAHAIVIRATSQDCASLFSEIDLLNIDGNHSPLASCRDVNLYLPKVKVGGFIWMDDTDWPETQQAVGLMSLMCKLVMDHGHYRLYQKV